MYEAKCSDCKKTTLLSFNPTKGKPVYCRSCLPRHRKKSMRQPMEPIKFNLKNAWARRGDNQRERKHKKTSVFRRN